MTKTEMNLFYRNNKYNLIEKTEEDIILHNKANDFINHIEDNITKQIFNYRYIRCLSWQQVANKISNNHTKDCVRKIAERYLERINTKKVEE